VAVALGAYVQVIPGKWEFQLLEKNPVHVIGVMLSCVNDKIV
jgi:hypothetical protein